MRTLGFGTKVFSVCFFAAALVLTLALPWYGPAPPPDVTEQGIGEIHGPLEGVFEAVVRWFGEFDGGSSAWASLEAADLMIVTFAALAAVCAVLANLVAVEHTVRSLLRGSVVVVVAIVALRMFDTPGDNAALEPRYGIFASAAAAVMLAISGLGLA